MKLIKKLKQMLAGANSKSEARTEQSEMARKTARSIEVTVETDEVILHHITLAVSPEKTVNQSKEQVDGQAGASDRPQRDL